LTERSEPIAVSGMRIGLLGGSFNPAHEGHRHISLEALKRLGLDQVWWLVSPGNPLKDPSVLQAVDARAESARKIAQHPRIEVTSLEAARGLVYTADTLRFLKARFPDVDFVWLMGADNLAQMHRWKDWRTLFDLVPIAVFDRPGWRLKARSSQAAQAFSSAYWDESDAAGLPAAKPPAWTMITLPLSPLSSTALRDKAAK
jgi:nicotinate-nucleotide adenylyltransferase